MVSEEKRGRAAWQLSPHLSSSHSLESQCLSPVTGCQHCSNGKTALLPSDINTRLQSLVGEEIEEVTHGGEAGHCGGILMYSKSERSLVGCAGLLFISVLKSNLHGRSSVMLAGGNQCLRVLVVTEGEITVVFESHFQEGEGGSR